MKKVLISGYIGFNNFGDEAIFYALVAHLKSLGLDIRALAYNKREVRKKYGIKTYNYAKPYQILKAILSCDILISGGGSLLQNKTSNKSLFYYLFIIFAAKLFFKKVVIFAQGIEPIKGNIACFITKSVLKTADFISVRDENSKKLLQDWKIESILVSDPAYSLVQDTEINQNKSGLLVQLRKTKNTDDSFLDDLAEFINKYYVGDIGVISFQDKYDEKICLDFTKKLEAKGAKASYIKAQSIDKTIDIINKTKYVISTRLHGLIIASALKSYCFALSYDKKIETFSNELNIRFVDLYNYKKDEFEDNIRKYFSSPITPNPYRRFEWECIDKFLENQEKNI